MKKIGSRLVLLLGVILVICLFVVGVPLVKFGVESAKADYQHPNINAPGITIVYRPNCPKCRQILPGLYFTETWKNLGHHVPIRIYNANKLTNAGLEQLEIEYTPSMIVSGKSYVIKSKKMGSKIWDSNTVNYDLK